MKEKYENSEYPCKHCLGITQNEIGEIIAFCEEWDEGRNVTLGDCFGNCECQTEMDEVGE